MAERVTTKSVTAEQDDVNREHDCADADSERTAAGHRLVEPERFPNVVAQDQNENEREIQKIAVHVLHDERERAFAKIRFAWLTDSAGRRIGPERFVVRTAIVITGQPKSARRP